MLVTLIAGLSMMCAPRAWTTQIPLWPRLGDRQPAAQTLSIRGRPQVLWLYGPRSGTPVVISSGDGGWFHLAPSAASLLASRGCFVVGFDVRAYLESFTRGTSTLRPEQVPRDYATLIAFASRETGRKPILIGASEGAGLSVLAASDPLVKKTVAGVVGLGLPDQTELAWRWRDAVIYITHGSPNEPAFSVRSIANRLAPLPLAAIHSTHDEYAPLAEVRHILDSAAQPKRLWVVDASNHRFSGNPDGFARALDEAIDWIDSVTPSSSGATRQACSEPG